MFIHTDLVLQTSRYFASRNMALNVFHASVKFLMLLLFFNGANSFEKPGTCPETSGGICILECESDDFCPGEEKCCYNGCGHTCQRPEKPECPESNCELDCTESGYKLDDNGCRLCECFVDQCPMIDCVPCPKYYSYTVIEGHICRGCDCVDSVKCPALGCQCPEGYKQDTGMDGCPVCRCLPEEPTCPELNYNLDCSESGYKLDSNGCRICECFMDQCRMINCVPCPKYYNYEVIDGHICGGCDCVDSVQCPELSCECPEGYKQDTGMDGCPVCRCVPEEPTCPELNCNLDCSDSGYKLNDNGCAICECYRNPCPLFKCRACPEYYNYRNISGNICRGCECVSNVDCPQLHCECPEGHKLDTDINGCPTCRCVPEPRCSELSCDLDCTESGYKLDNNGCRTCECFVNQCPMVHCLPCLKYYNYEVIEGHMCHGCDCVDSVQCPALGCECPEGYKQDTGRDGCSVCRCVPEEPICPELKCNLDCTETGYKLDSNGCAMCECFVNQCPMIDCIPCPKYYNYEVIDGHTCRGCNCVDSVQCPELGCKCPEGYKQDIGMDRCSVCRCVPEEPTCPELNCDLNCNESGYKLDSNGCAMCECYVDHCPMIGCTMPCPRYYNYTNIGGNICRACDCVSSVQCPELQCGCLEGTTQDTDINGCPTCRCVSEGRRGQDDLGCPMRMCAQNCPSGYEKDDQGCQTCNCLSTWENHYILIIVGCLVAILIVCGIVGVVLYRRRGRNNHSVSSDDIVKEPLDEKYLAVPTVDISIGDAKNPKV